VNHNTAMLNDPWTNVQLGDGFGVPVAIGGDLTPSAILGAHRRAVFCQARSDQAQISESEATYAPDVHAGDIPVLRGDSVRSPYGILWWSPADRYVIRVGDVHLGRTVRKSIRSNDWHTTVDRDFEGVMNGCRGDREPRWMTDELIEALRVLATANWVHTIEVWDGSELIGGLFGCAVGGVFIMESAFHRRPDAAKVAVADLAARAADGSITLLDTEVKSDYTVRMGALAMPREEYLTHLFPADQPGSIRSERRCAQYLLDIAQPAAA
jgi:leucyl/phenylalanyl-tRNA---protein transferase